MSAIVTGGLGFIGSNLVDTLINEGIETHVIDNLLTGHLEYLNSKATFYETDVLDYQQLKAIFSKVRPDAVFHLAAQTDVQTSIHQSGFDAQSNILGSLNMIELCKEFNCKLIYSSSAAVYGMPRYLPIDERHPISPESNYGVSKFTPELYIHTYAQLFNLKYIILRYANVYGIRQLPKGEGGVIAIFIDKLLKGEAPIIFGNGEQTRDFIYVDDVVSANLAAYKSEQNGIYNIGTNVRISINQLMKELNGILQMNVIPHYHSARKGDILHSCLDHQLAKQELNWEPDYSIYSGLAKTCEYYLKSGGGI